MVAGQVCHFICKPGKMSQMKMVKFSLQILSGSRRVSLLTREITNLSALVRGESISGNFALLSLECWKRECAQVSNEKNLRGRERERNSEGAPIEKIFKDM